MDMKENLRRILSNGPEPHLMTGEQYKESLRDGRRIIDSNGKEVEDPTTHPQLKNGIDTIAKFYDAQFEESTKDIFTYVDEEDGNRYSKVWKLPRNKNDLKEKRKMTEHNTYSTFGHWGRPPEYSSFLAMGMYTMMDAFQKSEIDIERSKNIGKFLNFGKKHNIMSAEIGVDVQSDKTIPVNEREGRLRVVEEREDGVVLYGAKTCGSVAAQAHYVVIVTHTHSPELDPNSAIWVAVPLNSKGLTHVLRESGHDTQSGVDFDSHPVNSLGEEMDSMLLFDHVFVPNELIFSIGNKDLLDSYGRGGNLQSWGVLSRMYYRAEIFAGVAQTIVDILDTGNFQGVRDDVVEVVRYAKTLQAFILASEEEGEYQNGVFVPNSELISAGRIFSIEEYPLIMHTLRDLSGQGIIMRFTKSTWNHPDVKEKFDKMLPGTGVTAYEKNKFFNLVWDITSSYNASRVAMFENTNSQNAHLNKAALYRTNDRTENVNFIRKYLGLPLVEKS